MTHEAEFDAFWTVTSLMAPFYGLLDHGAAWLTGKGVPPEAAGRYVGAMFHALAENARQAGTEGFARLTESSQTPGGLNEETYRAFSGGGPLQPRGSGPGCRARSAESQPERRILEEFIYVKPIT